MTITSRHATLALALTLLAHSSSPSARSAEPTKTNWGHVTPLEDGSGQFLLKIAAPPKNNKLRLPAPFANITRARYYPSLSVPCPLDFQFNKDATEIDVYFAGSGCKTIVADVLLETAEMTTQFPDGRIVLSALNATVNGKTAKLETHPGNHRIGFWSNESDYVSWNYNATRTGMYDVELTYSGAGNDRTEIEIAVGDKKLSAKLAATGSWYRYTTLRLGKLELTKPGNCPVTVRCTKKTGGAVMNLKAVTLRPTCEGQPPVQGKDGIIELHARDVTIHGVKVRWEPNPKKNTVGYWANPKDYVSWRFKVERPGRFDVEIFQGCGKGQGGSQVAVSLGEQKLEFTVQDTGHFQNFIERRIGQISIDKPGWHQFIVRPMKKAKVAVMDLRRVRLIPTTK